MRLRSICSAVAFVALATASSAFATPITFTGTGTADSQSVSATAAFSFSGDNLTIVLTNTSTSGPTSPGATLTGLFFDLSNGTNSNPLLSSDSASVTSGSSIIQGGTCKVGTPQQTQSCTGDTNVGGEFGYALNGSTGKDDDNNSVTNDFGSRGSEGIASSGYLHTDKTKNLGNFDSGQNLDNPDSLDGINFGIVSSAYTTAGANGGLTGDPLIKDSVTFVFDNAAGFGNGDISNVSFQYGTAFSEANIPGTPGTPVPEPGELGLFLLGLAGALFGYRRLRRGC